MMPLRDEPYVFADLPRNEYNGLPPVFADSLPDGFGSGLIDRWMQEKGFLRSEITALDRQVLSQRVPVADRFAIGTGPRVLREVKSALGVK